MDEMPRRIENPIATSPAKPGIERHTERLRDGRRSVPGATYFVTFVTAARTPWLRAPAAAAAVLDAIGDWHAEGDGAVLAATVMPDHVHVLFKLGARLDLGRCVSRWKTVARKTAHYAGGWQRDFWEHRLRDDESPEEYGLYVFLNPYRAGFAGRGEIWPWWWSPRGKLRSENSGGAASAPAGNHAGLGSAGFTKGVDEPRPYYEEARFRFLENLDVTGAPPSEWIDWSEERFATLATGE